MGGFLLPTLYLRSICNCWSARWPLRQASGAGRWTPCICRPQPVMDGSWWYPRFLTSRGSAKRHVLTILGKFTLGRGPEPPATTCSLCCTLNVFFPFPLLYHCFLAYLPNKLPLLKCLPQDVSGKNLTENSLFVQTFAHTVFLVHGTSLCQARC